VGECLSGLENAKAIDVGGAADWMFDRRPFPLMKSNSSPMGVKGSSRSENRIARRPRWHRPVAGDGDSQLRLRDYLKQGVTLPQRSASAM
jgi:hypothetical protein